MLECSVDVFNSVDGDWGKKSRRGRGGEAGVDDGASFDVGSNAIRTEEVIDTCRA
jgi:hypothetical protein